MAVLGLCCCVDFSLVATSRGYCLVAVCGLLITVTSRCRAQALEHVSFGSCSCHALDHRFSSCGSPAWLLHSTWDLTGPGIKPVSLGLTGILFTTEVPGKPPSLFKSIQINMFIHSLTEDYEVVSYQEVRLVSS